MSCTRGEFDVAQLERRAGARKSWTPFCRTFVCSLYGGPRFIKHLFCVLSCSACLLRLLPFDARLQQQALYQFCCCACASGRGTTAGLTSETRISFPPAPAGPPIGLAAAAPHLSDCIGTHTPVSVFAAPAKQHVDRRRSCARNLDSCARRRASRFASTIHFHRQCPFGTSEC